MTNADDADDDDAVSELRAFHDYGDPRVADRAIGAVMARVAASPIEAIGDAASERVLAEVSMLWYPALAAAALVMIVAGLAVTSTPVAALKSQSPAEAQLRDWANSGHVPTNRDLVTTFTPGIP